MTETINETFFVSMRCNKFNVRKISRNRCGAMAFFEPQKIKGLENKVIFTFVVQGTMDAIRTI